MRDSDVHLSRVREHRRLGEHAPAWTVATERLGDGLEPAAVADVERAAAAAAIELGRFTDAREHLGRAAAADPDDQWLAAGALEAAYRAEAAGHDAALPALREPYLRRARTQAHEQPAPRRVPWLWLIASLLTGVHPDERPTWTDLDLADGCLSSAAATDPSSPAVALARVRVARCRIAVGRRRGALVDAAGSLVAQHRRQLPSTAPSEPITGLDLVCDALDYEQGRLLLYAHQPEEAAQFFGKVLAPHRRPGHQAARAWQLTAQRVSSTATEALLTRVESALPANLRRAAGDDDAGPSVVAPDHVAHLLVERAILLERPGPLRDLDAALSDHRAALERRPRMEAAFRGVLRTLVALQRPDEAEHEAAAARDRFADDPPAPLLVEIGHVEVEIGHLDAAAQTFEDARGQLPTYGPAYRATMRLQRRTQGTAAALETHAAALDAGCDDLGGVRTEAAAAFLEDGRSGAATKVVAPVLTHPHAHLRRGAQALRARAALLDRRLEEACELAGADADDPDLVAVHGAAVTATGQLGLAAIIHADACARFGDGRDLREQTRFTIALARSHRALGRLTAAQRLCDEQLERVRRAGTGTASLRDASTQLLTERGWIALDRSDAPSALTSFAEALAQQPADAAASSGRLVAMGRTGQPWETVRAALTTTLKRDDVRRRRGAGTLLRVHGGRVALEHGQVGQAEELFADRGTDAPDVPLVGGVVSWLLAAGWVELAADHLDGLTTRNPALASDHLVGLLRARTALAARRHDEATMHVEAVLERFPRSEPALLTSAALDLASGDARSARATLDGLVEASPHHVHARQLRMWALITAHAQQTGGSDDAGAPLAEARAEARRIMQLEPAAPAALSGLGVLAGQAGRTAEAAGYLRQAVRLSDGAAARRGDLAALHVQRGEPDAALEVLGSPADGHEDARMLLVRGWAHHDRGEVELAIRSLRRAVQRDPQDPEAARGLALALAAASDLQAAVDTCDRALRAVPRRRSARLLLTRAKLLHAHAVGYTGRARERLLEAALADIDRAEAVLGAPSGPDARDLPDLWYQRAVVLLAQRNRIAARRALARCLTADPEHGRALHAIRLLDAPAPGGDTGSHLRRWSRVLGVAATTALAVVGVLLVTTSAADPNREVSGVLVAAAAGLLGFLALAAVLPRIAGSDGGVVPQLRLDDEALVTPPLIPRIDGADLGPPAPDGPTPSWPAPAVPDLEQAPFLRAAEPASGGGTAVDASGVATPR